MATSTVEDYLKAILLEEEHRAAGEPISTGRIAALIQVVPGTATSMVKALADAGLVAYEPYSGARLTEAGRRLAASVLRRHRLVELFLVQVMGMNWSEVHEEAEQLEHAISDRLLERMDEMLGRPAVDPHGDPIPDAQGVVATAAPGATLVACPVGQPLRVTRVLDQTAEFLRLLERWGLKPGSELEVVARDEAADTVDLIVVAPPGRFSLGERAASKILVEALSRNP